MTFKHSNQLEQEMEYARLNREYLEVKRNMLEPPAELKEKNDKKGRPRINKYCCWLIFIITTISVFVIYYFVANIKDAVVEDYYKKQKQVQELLPQGQEEVKKGVEQGEALITETQKSVENLQKKYDETKNTVEEVEKKYKELKELKENVEKAIGN